MMISLNARHLTPEVMDQQNLDPQRHRQALRGLGRVNRLSRTAGILWKRIRTLEPHATGARLRVLDLACGGGDVLLDLAERSRSHPIPIDFFGSDLSPTAILHATEAAERRGNSNVTFSQADALHDDLSGEVFDIVYCTLFLHHLNHDNATTLMRRMTVLASQAVLIDDLRRTGLGYVLAWVGCRMLSRSPIVHADGPSSARAAFTEQEVLQMAAEAGMQVASLTRHWPQRFLLDWRRS